jgi:hypothetical protein
VDFESHIVMNTSNPCGPLEPCGAAGLAPYLDLEPIIEGDVEDDVQNVWKDGVGAAQTKASKATRVVAISKFKEIRKLLKHVKNNGTIAKSDRKLGGLTARTSDLKYVSVSCFLSKANPREWFSKDRGPRFWVPVLVDSRGLPPGHNCEWGTMVASRIKGDLLAIGRVHRIYDDIAKSCKLVCGKRTKQELTLELCHEIVDYEGAHESPENERDESFKRFEASCCYFTIDSSEVVAVDLNLEPEGSGLKTAVLAKTVWEPLTKSYGPFVNHSSLLDTSTRVSTSNDNGIEIREHEDPALAQCCRCGIGWWSDKSGAPRMCNGVCARWFHPKCMDAPS